MFQANVPGKWILTGEHTVVRGGKALVFPLLSKCLRLRHFDSPQSLPSKDAKILSDALATAARGAKKFLETQGQKKSAKKNAANFQFPIEQFTVDSSIPIGSGLGSSAALCVALAKWFASKGRIYEEEIFGMALEMEHAFHGKSSGMDVAVALAMQPLEFQLEKTPKSFSPSWCPHIYLLDSGERSTTKESVLKVMGMHEHNPEKFNSVDKQMKESVELALQSLCSDSGEDSFEALNKAIHIGRECYSDWGLVTPAMQTRAESALEAGANAWKPTGSGQGGFIITLWKEDPSQELIQELGLISGN